MKLLIITPDFYPSNGGYANAVTSFIYNILKYTNTKIDVITFIPLNGKKELSVKNLQVFRLKWIKFGKGINFLLNEIRLAKKIISMDKKNNYDFIMFETTAYPITGLILLKMNGFLRKTFARVHASAETEWLIYLKGINHRIKKIFTGLLFRKLKIITATNKYHLRFVIKHFLSDNPFKYGEKRFFVIPNTTLPIKLDKKKEIEFSKKFKFLEGKYTFLTLGRMWYPGYIEKNFFRILEALYYLKKKKYYQKLFFIFIGEGEYQKKLKKFSKSIGIGDKIKFINRLSNEEVQFLQKKVSCIVLASLHEGMSSFAIESLKNGGCLLFSKTGGLIELINEGKNGYFIDPVDAKDIAEKMDMVITNLLPKINLVRKNSKKLYKEKFKPKKIIDSFMNFLNLLKGYRKVNV